MARDPQDFPQGDRQRRELFDTVLRDHAKTIVHYCVTRLGVFHGEDAAQEVFMTVAERLSTFCPEQDMSAWIFGIAHNKCRQLLRKRRRRAAIAAAAVAEIQDYVHGATPPSPESILEQRLHVHQQRTQLVACLAQLSAEDQLVLRWRYIKGLSVTDIAALLDLREMTARKRLDRAVSRLKEKMGHVAAG